MDAKERKVVERGAEYSHDEDRAHHESPVPERLLISTRPPQPLWNAASAATAPIVSLRNEPGLVRRRLGSSGFNGRLRLFVITRRPRKPRLVRVSCGRSELHKLGAPEPFSGAAAPQRRHRIRPTHERRQHNPSKPKANTRNLQRRKRRRKLLHQHRAIDIEDDVERPERERSRQPAVPQPLFSLRPRFAPIVVLAVLGAATLITPTRALQRHSRDACDGEYHPETHRESDAFAENDGAEESRAERLERVAEDKPPRPEHRQRHQPKRIA
mmetsp:Transcript_12148/g.39948  ORF Transcript_12148/g.39948 Transcript_12148/m.39948 type:complete len:270 (-) Transcript_12148:414-1223(-)